MSKRRFTGKNKQAAKFLGIPPEKFQDPGFCLGCGENPCVCDDEQEDRDECERCGGEGSIEYADAGPDVWGEDCPSEVNHLVECPDCGGTGIAR